MEIASLWITPLVLMPGVGLLVMSTAMRFGQVHEELHRHASHEGDRDDGQALVARATMLRNALVSLYGAVALLAVAGLVGGLGQIWMTEAATPVLILTAAAVASVVYAAVTLIRESVLLVRVIEAHRRELAAESSSQLPGRG